MRHHTALRETGVMDTKPIILSRVYVHSQLLIDINENFLADVAQKVELNHELAITRVVDKNETEKVHLCKCERVFLVALMKGDHLHDVPISGHSHHQDATEESHHTTLFTQSVQPTAQRCRFELLKEHIRFAYPVEIVKIEH